MNLHVVVVHFPIALLSLYSFLEILYFKRLRSLSYMFYIKAFLVVVGAGSAALAVLSGDSIQRNFRGFGRLLHLHSFFGKLTLVYFGILAAAYLLLLLNRTVWFGKYKKWKPIGLAVSFCGWFLNSPLMPVLGLAGLAIITITGALGGAMVFGPDVDPAVRLVYNLFHLP